MNNMNYTDEDFQRLERELHAVRVLALTLARLVPPDVWRGYFVLANSQFIVVQKQAKEYDGVTY